MYVKLENNIPVKWPVPEYEVRNSFPNISLPEYPSAEILKDLGYGIFIVNGYPSGYDPELQDIEEITPVLKDGKYHQSYKITEKYTPEEKEKIFHEKLKTFNKSTASRLLLETDWIELSSVSDPLQSNLYLTNKLEFIAYRNQLRTIAINPPETLVTNWPVKPDAIWSK